MAMTSAMVILMPTSLPSIFMALVIAMNMEAKEARNMSTMESTVTEIMDTIPKQHQKQRLQQALVHQDFPWGPISLLPLLHSADHFWAELHLEKLSVVSVFAVSISA